MAGCTTTYRAIEIAQLSECDLAGALLATVVCRCMERYNNTSALFPKIPKELYSLTVYLSLKLLLWHMSAVLLRDPLLLQAVSDQ